MTEKERDEFRDNYKKRIQGYRERILRLSSEHEKGTFL